MFLHFSDDEQMNFQINRALMSVLSDPALPPQTGARVILSYYLKVRVRGRREKMASSLLTNGKNR